MRLSIFLLGIKLLLWDFSPRDESSICLSNMTTVIHQICICEGQGLYSLPGSMEFSRQEYWSGLLFCSPGDPPDPGIKPVSSALQADSSPSESQGKPYFPYVCINTCIQLYICVPINMCVCVYIYIERERHVHSYVRRCLCGQTDTCQCLSLIQPHMKRNCRSFFWFCSSLYVQCLV